ncbi:hypothetical protein DFH09DRAFT_1039972 [Mycena vulgaris]|nr:hypothetical protein DFH09DRAFT_1039972 [Mycena vulgaris]
MPRSLPLCGHACPNDPTFALDHHHESSHFAMYNQPTFPRELEREIFEITALVHPKMIATLLRVARRVLIWIEPFLYRVIRVEDSSMGDAFLEATSSKPPSFFRDAVRHVLLDAMAPWPVDVAKDVLKICTGVVNIALCGKFSTPEILPVLAEMPIQRLAAHLEQLFGDSPIDPAYPAFTSITHLHIFDDYPEAAVLDCIPALPALTHLCLSEEVAEDTVTRLLAECPRLDLLVIPWDISKMEWAESWAQDARIEDVRCVVMVYIDWVSNWEAGAHGLPDFWSAAEAFVKKKRSGDSEAICYWWGML